jgi:hypothetical protein
VIDLGDGSGAQVFRGNTLEELVDNLAKAQENATRKIRELSSAQKAAIKVVEEEKGLTDDERFILSQQILTDPDKVINAFIEKAIAKKVGPKLAKVDEMERREREETARVEFVENTPDYYAAPRNGARMVAWMQTHGYEHTVENLQKAFEDLNASGLLEARPKEKQDAESDAEEAKPERIVPARVETVTKRKVVGGLSTKRQAVVVAKPSEPTVEDLYKMPTHELEALTLRMMREQN